MFGEKERKPSICIKIFLRRTLVICSSEQPNPQLLIYQTQNLCAPVSGLLPPAVEKALVKKEE